MTYGTPKGKDAKIGNELSEPKKGQSKTEIMALMKKMSGVEAHPPEAPTSALLPGMKKGGRSGL